MSVTVVLSGTELEIRLLVVGRTMVLLACVVIVLVDNVIGMTVVTMERLEYVLSTVVPFPVLVAVRGHQVV